MLLTPISSAVLGVVLLSDQLGPIQLLGAALILAGIAVSSGAIGAVRPAALRPGPATRR